MADTRENLKRFGSLFLASIFLISTIGVTALVFWQTKDQQKTESELQQQLDVQTHGEQTNQTGENMLQGTALADFTPGTAPITELQVTDLVVGDGEEAKADSTVTAHYTGALVGTIFQSSLDSGSPFTSPLSGLIEGWQKGIPGMKVGGKRRLIIPYAQAYGEAGSPPSIPGKADLVFDIELISLGEQ